MISDSLALIYYCNTKRTVETVLLFFLRLYDLVANFILVHRNTLFSNFPEIINDCNRTIN